MGNSGQSVFHFQQFSVYQNHCAMKVGFDGVLLGAWASTTHARHILDIGTGTGLIALMLAQRAPEAHIQGIEIDPAAAQQAQENVAISPWKSRIQVVHQSLQHYQQRPPQPFDLIVSNPPYFRNSTPSETLARNLARHTHLLTLETLLNTSHLLTDQGRMALIWPWSDREALFNEAKNLGWYCDRLLNVRPRIHQPYKRILVELSRSYSSTICHEMAVEIKRHHYTDDYRQLVHDFLLRYRDNPLTSRKPQHHRHTDQ